MTYILLLMSAALVIAAVAWWVRMDRQFDEYIAGCRAMGYGKKCAGLGLGREDYPLDYTSAEREAWQRGWDEWHEDRT